MNPEEQADIKKNELPDKYFYVAAARLSYQINSRGKTYIGGEILINKKHDLTEKDLKNLKNLFNKDQNEDD